MIQFAGPPPFPPLRTAFACGGNGHPWADLAFVAGVAQLFRMIRVRLASSRSTSALRNEGSFAEASIARLTAALSPAELAVALSAAPGGAACATCAGAGEGEHNIAVLAVNTPSATTFAIDFMSTCAFLLSDVAVCG